MKIAVVSLTRKGSSLGATLGRELCADVYIKEEFIPELAKGKEAVEIKPLGGDFMQFTGELFRSYQALVFIMACGIVVRAIAPYIKNKGQDPAVVVADEKGRHYISLLSGHLGGANELAQRAAAVTGGTAVITTSTDVNNVIAFDVFAAKNHCVIENIKALKHISSCLVNGGTVGLYSDYRIKEQLPDYIEIISAPSEQNAQNLVVLSNRTDIGINEAKVLLIRPKNLILGIGCRRGVSKEAVKKAVDRFMEASKRSLLSIKAASTIDLKEDEKGIVDYCSDSKIPLNIIDRELIKSVEESFVQSDFVKRRIGVGSVAEPCAVLGGSSARLICGKAAYEGITLALAEEEKDFSL